MASHILIVANTAWSIYNFRIGLIRKLLELRFLVTVVAPNDDYSAKLKAIGCNVVNIKMSAKGVNPFVDAKFIFDLYLIYVSLKPNFIFNYTIKPNIYGSFASRLAGIPSIAITTGLGYTFLNDNWVSKVARALYALAFRYPKEIWFLNEDDRSDFLSYQLVAKSNTRLLHSEGINLEHFKPVSIKLINRQFSFLLVARMLWDKGVGEYVEAAGIVKKIYPNVSFKLLGACGVDNPSAISHRQISQWETRGVIEYLGVVDDVRGAISQADCLVLPSYREGVPRTMMEAAAMEKPLIVSDVPGCRDVVLDCVTGFICEPRNADCLASKMMMLLRLSEEERSNMGSAGRAFMDRQFNENKVISQYINTLEKYNVIFNANEIHE
ncbi:MAG: glycosyltransferase family 4 protein [Plesiomonas sp.]